MQGPRPGICRQFARCGKALGQPHGFANAIDDRQLPVAQFADDHVKTVGTEIDSRYDLGSISIRRGVGDVFFARSDYLLWPL